MSVRGRPFTTWPKACQWKERNDKTQCIATSVPAAARVPQRGAEPLIGRLSTEPSITASTTSKALYLPSRRLSARRTITSQTRKTRMARRAICDNVRSSARTWAPSERSTEEASWFMGPPGADSDGSLRFVLLGRSQNRLLEIPVDVQDEMDG